MTAKKNAMPGAIASNKKAYFDYEILETYETGIALKGTEVKTLRKGLVTMSEAYCVFTKGELFVINMNIPHYDFGNINNHAPMRTRKLLMHKRELVRLQGKIKEQGLTLVPLKLYFSGRHIKLAVGLARGKKKYDKRETIKKRETERELSRYKNIQR